MYIYTRYPAILKYYHGGVRLAVLFRIISFATSASSVIQNRAQKRILNARRGKMKKKSNI